MARPKMPKSRVFSVFRSAAEEAEMKDKEQQWENEGGGHMSCTSGRIVMVSGAGKPFKAIMSREGEEPVECEFATMREAEAFVRRNTPRAAERSTMFDRGPRRSPEDV